MSLKVSMYEFVFLPLVVERVNASSELNRLRPLITRTGYIKAPCLLEKFIFE